MKTIAIILLLVGVSACSKSAPESSVPEWMRIEGAALEVSSLDLSWDAEPGAATYGVSARLVEADTPWFWTGSETRVTFGGLDIGDAIATEPGQHISWSVTAFDGDGAILAVSEMRTDQI